MAVAFSSGVFTPEGFAEALERFGASLRPAVVRGLKRSAKIPRAIYMAKARQHGIVRTIFGKKPKGLGGLVKTKVTDKGSVFVLSMELRGLAAMQESGGRTKQHQIGPGAKKLKLKVPSLGVVIRDSVLHRGSNIHVFPAANSAMATAAPKIQAAIEREVALFEHGGVRIVSSAVA
jgi:hypothetical protein